jgi:NAD(P)-dependent dehydrogenase (short-subunit alcohol dehydrogenase family)
VQIRRAQFVALQSGFGAKNLTQIRKECKAQCRNEKNHCIQEKQLSMNQPLQGKIAIVTGGATGIGYAVAERLAQEGAQVTIASRNAQRLEEAAQRIGHGTRAIPTDVSVDEQVKHLLDQFERVDLLVTCAGGGLFGPVEDVPLDMVREQFATRVFGQLAAAHFAVPKMPAGSSIIFCSGIADSAGLPLFSGGSAIDGAINAMMRSLSIELAPKNIRVNAVSPGLIGETEIKNNLSPEQMQGFFEATIEMIPLKRAGRPSEVADAVFFLATCAYMHGQVIEVDGGWTAT